MSTELGTTAGVSFTRLKGHGQTCKCQVSTPYGAGYAKLTPAELRALAHHCLRAADACEGNGYSMDTTPRDLSERALRSRRGVADADLLDRIGRIMEGRGR